MCGEAMAQGVRRDALQASARSVAFHHRPRLRARERRTRTLKKEKRAVRSVGARTHTYIFLQPLDCALAYGHAPLFASLSITGDQPCIQIHVRAFELHHL